MAYLESKHVVHRDLAARNVLLSEEGQVKMHRAAKDLNQYLDMISYPIP